MKKLLQHIKNILSGHSDQPQNPSDNINLDILSNLELAHSFNHAVYLHFNEQNGNLTSFTGIISSITERQAVVKDLRSNQIRIVLLNKIKKVTFVPENVKNSMIDQKNA
ncbi:hypothetical protein [Pseudolactococcus insecticola]|uniref:YolD-like protein n=1 Tax=Pseudolactococcus insecticola TaxID=2709158 RepID=A0A6A0B868_9LACT|nr:hypothetical protein [Lactococcus insecticola]GFH40564.1 hypothetical protein Hs20B_09620 [Lactococcus insecticola]